MTSQRYADLTKFISNENEYEHHFNTKYSPLTSVDVERSFSQYKRVLTDNRHMSFETIEQLNVIQFNQFLNSNDNQDVCDLE